MIKLSLSTAIRAGEHIMQIRVRLDVIKLAGLCRPPNYAESSRFPQISR